MKRIVVGTDGTEAAHAAVVWAARLCEVTHAELVVASAWTPEEDTGDQETEGARRDERRWLLAECWSEPGRREGVTLETRLLEGRVRDELPRVASEEDADLVVIGVSTDVEHPNRLARHLLHHLHCALAIVAPDPAPVSGGSLVVGVDGSRASATALGWAVDIARDCGAAMAAVCAHDPLADTYPHPDTDTWPYHGETAVRAEIERARDGSVAIDLVRRAGKPQHVLEEVADELDASAIVVGTRGRGGFHGLIVGRVPIRLVKDARRTVVVVPH